MPKLVERELDGSVGCGVLARGFARVRFGDALVHLCELLRQLVDDAREVRSQLCRQRCR